MILTIAMFKKDYNCDFDAAGISKQIRFKSLQEIILSE